MRRVQEIESVIDSFAEDEYNELRDWFWERDWAKWDREIEADAASGRLDFLLQEARDGKGQETLRNL
jgi:hypothetical protein